MPPDQLLILDARAAGLLLLATMTTLIVACGGGGTGAASGGASMGNASFSDGTLTGFGSIFVNGSEYDISSAKITDDFGNLEGAGALKLGMHVEVTGNDADPGATPPGQGTAVTVQYWSDLEGPVSAVEGDTIEMLGQTVDATPDTVWDAALVGQLAGLTAGEVIKVYSLYDSASSRYLATRIEADSTATHYKIRGMVSDVDTLAKSYMVGNVPVDYTGVRNPPANLATGVIATAELQTARRGFTWMATGLQVHSGAPPANHVLMHLRGVISTESAPTSFVLDGWRVDASSATFADGQLAIVAGAVVQVEGIMTGGSLVATSVELASGS